MQTLTLNIPDRVDLNHKDTVKFIAAKLYEAGKLTLGEAAEVTGISKTAFAEILGDYNVSIINHPISEIKGDAGRI